MLSRSTERVRWPCRHRCHPRPPPRHAHNHNHNHNHTYHHTASARVHPDADAAAEDVLLNWPKPIAPHATPTPYQILQCAKGEVYSKHRFCALVKLYHPDRSYPAASIDSLPRNVRLDRYRLLVAAHAILSDADKRSAYDASGHGWAGHHAPHHQRDWEFDANRWATDPRYNATWEDWERWYADNAGSQAPDDHTSRPVQLSNRTFVALLIAFFSIGGIAQGTRLTTFNASVLERREQVHREASLELRRSHHATLAGDRHERIRTFVQHRDSALIGEQNYQRVLPPASNCDSDALRRQ